MHTTIMLYHCLGLNYNFWKAKHMLILLVFKLA